MVTGELGLNYNIKLGSLSYRGEVFDFNTKTTNTNVVNHGDGIFTFSHNDINFEVNATDGHVVLRGSKERLEQFHTKGTYDKAYLADVDNGIAIDHKALRDNSRYSAKNLTTTNAKSHRIFKPLNNWLNDDSNTIDALTHLNIRHRKIAHHDTDTLERDLKQNVKLNVMKDRANLTALQKLVYLRKEDEFKPEDYKFIFQNIQADRLTSYKEHARRILKKLDQLQALEHVKNSARDWIIETASEPVEMDEGELLSSTDSDDVPDEFVIIPAAADVQIDQEAFEEREAQSRLQLSRKQPTRYMDFPAPSSQTGPTTDARRGAEGDSHKRLNQLSQTPAEPVITSVGSETFTTQQITVDIEP
ncbi:MAG: hypothetical protein HAW66_09155 [Shewanella sp.]|nr:hypothetical protein [Shewanella sp.]